jgi:mannose-6-phosphate isomerase-like protein (cupin superfamily)
MSLKPGEEIDLELHRGHDQFIRIEEGHATVYMGKNQEDLDFEKEVADDWVVMIPAGYWHKVINTGMTDLKLYTLYAPAEHKTGTIHETHDEAKAHDHEHYNVLTRVSPAIMPGLLIYMFNLFFS